MDGWLSFLGKLAGGSASAGLNHIRGKNELNANTSDEESELWRGTLNLNNFLNIATGTLQITNKNMRFRTIFASGSRMFGNPKLDIPINTIKSFSTSSFIMARIIEISTTEKTYKFSGPKKQIDEIVEIINKLIKV